MFLKLPFYIGNLVACFVPGSDRRAHVRGCVNVFLYRPWIKSFIKETYGVPVQSIKFVRQRTLNRVVCLVNNQYYVKIFRKVSVARLKDFEFLVNYVSSKMKVIVPNVIVSDKYPMYVCERINGLNITDFKKSFVLQNENKFLSQVDAIIDDLQSIDITKLPNLDRFRDSMQYRHPDFPTPGTHPVLGHFDLNETNFVFDKDMNIYAVIDWDALSVANNPETDRKIFTNFWNSYKKHAK